MNSRWLSLLSTVSFVLGLVLASPGLLLLIGSSLLMGMAIDRERGVS